MTQGAVGGAAGPQAGQRPGPAIVDDPAQLTPAWFDAVLGTTVRARLEQADGGRRSAVVKYARPGDVSPMAGMAYAKEVAFYTELGGRLAVRTPACHYAAIAEDHLRFVLVLEDLAEARQGDQLAGCSVDQAAAALVNLAGLHGPTWCDTELAAAPWLTTDPSITSEFMAPVIEAAADAFAERFADELTAPEAAVLEASRELLPAWLFDHGGRVAVTHGDYRLDNLLYADDPADVTVVDWQTAAVAPPARDVAFFLSTSLETDLRRRHERDLLAVYRQALASHGVTGYEADDCLDDYRLAMLHAPFIVLLGRLTAGVTDRGDDMFRAMWRRSAAAIDDHGTLDLVRTRLHP